MLRRSLICCIVFAFTSVVLAVEAPLPRHPAPSPDGEQIAFSWQGDLWIVPSAGGEARRLTAHPAAERFPVWSRDGRYIAFASDRYGNDDVFVLATDGSEAPRRLTFASIGDVPQDFTPDGSAVLFSSQRARSIRWMPGLYTVPLTGGSPTLAQDALGQGGTYAPDSHALAYVRGATPWTRRGYRGAANRELWLRTAEGDDVRLTHFDGDDDYPCWVDTHRLAFLSSRPGRKNVFTLDLLSDEINQLTHHEGSDVRFPRGAADGSFVAYEFEDGIWTVDFEGGQPQRLHIEVPADQVVNPVRRQSVSKGASDLVVSPDGSLAAFVVHGDIFVTAIMSKDDQEIARPATVQVTETPGREKDLSWAPDGEKLLFSSNRDGGFDLFLTSPANEDTPWTEAFDFQVERLTSGSTEDTLGAFSPDGEHIAFVRGKGALLVMASGGGSELVLFEHWDTPSFDWSPDGRWIVYSIPDLHYNSEVYLIQAEGGEAYNLSRHPDEDLSPRWSPDGRRIVWISKRHADTFDVWGAWLTRADHERTPEEWLKLWKNGDGEKDAADEPEESDDEQETDDAAAEIPAVEVELDGLWERAVALTDLKGDEGFGLVSPDGKRVVLSADHEGERDLYSIRYDGDDIERLTEGGQRPSEVQFSKDGKTLFYLASSGVVKRVDLAGKAGDPVPFSARFEVDTSAERAAVFDEAWRALNEWFYDPAFHGVDWPDRFKTYRPWALAASHEDDFSDIMNLMIDELNASHMRYVGPSTDDDGDVTGFIGTVFDPSKGGPGLLISEVLRDTPAARRDVDLEPGDRILAVNGEQVVETTNIYGLFVDTMRQRVALTVLDADGQERRVVVVPTSFARYRQARYETWVRQRRALVDELSGGRLGFIHIQGMNIPSFEEFERQLFAAGSGKEGLVIDVRSNGGGWTTDYLMTVLSVERHAYTVPRDADPDVRAYPQGRLPLAAWTRPAVTLCNEDSYSNAEIFSWAFQTLDRGRVVGSPTFGAVISTGGTYLVNGGYVRLPLRGWYVAGSGINLENNGVRPDLEVWSPPIEDMASDQDSQLAAAVKDLLENLEDDSRYGAW